LRWGSLKLSCLEKNRIDQTSSESEAKDAAWVMVLHERVHEIHFRVPQMRDRTDSTQEKVAIPDPASKEEESECDDVIDLRMETQRKGISFQEFQDRDEEGKVKRRAREREG
jgi:hypothetical protein